MISTPRNAEFSYRATAPDGTVLEKNSSRSLGETVDLVAAVHTDGVWTANSLWPRGAVPKWVREQSNHKVLEAHLVS